MVEEHNFMDEWRERNNLLIFRIKECPQESYFNILKITEDIMRMTLKVDILSWYIESVHRLCKKRERRPMLVRFISFMKKSETLHATRNLAGTKTRTEHDCKVQEIRRQLTPYFKEARQQGNTFKKTKTVININAYVLELLQESHQIQNTNKTSVNPPTQNHVTLQLSPRRQTPEVNRQKEVQLEEECRKHKTHSGRIMNQKAGRQHKQLT